MKYPLICSAIVAATLSPALAIDQTEKDVSRLAVPIFQHRYCGEPLNTDAVTVMATDIAWKANVRPTDAIDAARIMGDRLIKDLMRKGKLDDMCRALKEAFP